MFFYKCGKCMQMKFENPLKAHPTPTILQTPQCKHLETYLIFLNWQHKNYKYRLLTPAQLGSSSPYRGSKQAGSHSNSVPLKAGWFIQNVGNHISVCAILLCVAIWGIQRIEFSTFLFCSIFVFNNRKDKDGSSSHFKWFKNNILAGYQD